MFLLFLSCLALIFTVSVNSVSAANGDVIYVNGSHGNDSWDGLSWDTAKLSIKNATGTVNINGTVNIADGIYTGENNTGVTINQNMTIKGQSQKGTVIDAQNSTRVFTIAKGVNVTIWNLTLINGNPGESDGGAIASSGSCTVKNCTFKDNSAVAGGAVASSGSCTISACTFEDNSAVAGGAIGNSGFCIVKNCIFTGNTGNGTLDSGGAICNWGSCNIEDCKFTGNTAYEGGAIYNDRGSLTVKGCNFTENTVTSDFGEGGAICNYFGSCTVKNCNFTCNTAGYNGGAVVNSGSCTMENCDFTGNTAVLDGGAIYNSGAAFRGDFCAVKNCNFVGNTATIEGGAIFNFGLLSVDDCSFYNNTATAGGAIYNTDAGSCNVKSCIFHDNRVNCTSYGSGGTGGAIYNDASINVENCTFTGNKANYASNEGIGGAIYNNGVSCDLKNCNFNGNCAGQVAGAIYCGASITVENCTFVGNTAGQLAGAISNTDSCDITNCTFINNSALVAGAIFNTGSCDAESCIFTGNSARAGGGVYNSGLCYINFSCFKWNTAIKGGAIYSNNGSVDATLNWWGSNNGPSSGQVSGNVTVDPWLILTVTADPDEITVGRTSAVIADLQHDNHGNYYDPSDAHVPDGITVNFTATNGTTSPTKINLVNGQIKTLFTATNAGKAVITATVDNQTCSTQIIIRKDSPSSGSGNEVKAASSVNMQKTGLPLNYLILAIFAVLSGWVIPRMKN